MAYQDLGPKGPQLGVSDANFQINPFLLGTGWDVIFTSTELGTQLSGVQIYQISLDGPVGSSVWMMRDRKEWNFISQGWQNYDDPQQPIILGQTNEIQFCWNVAFTSPPYNRTSNVQPRVTLWLRREIAPPGL